MINEEKNCICNKEEETFDLFYWEVLCIKRQGWDITHTSCLVVSNALYMSTCYIVFINNHYNENASDLLQFSDFGFLNILFKLRFYSCHFIITLIYEWTSKNLPKHFAILMFLTNLNQHQNNN